MARTTDSLQVGMVRRLSDGAVFEVATWLPTLTLGEIHTLRPRLRQKSEKAQFACFCCGHPVLMRQHATGGHYFAHKEKTAADKANCLYQEDQHLSLADIDRLRYQGQREGARHIRTKDLIARILKSDSRFATPVLEQTWTSFTDGWRKPDVATIWDGLPVVFEAQVSNTYPQIVAERTEFYRNQGALLIWIFDRLPDTHWRTLHADTFCANQQQMFLVDEESAALSEKSGVAHFRIYSQRPDVEAFCRPEDGRYILLPCQVEQCEMVAFSSLSLDPVLQTATRFNATEEENRVKHKILCALTQAGESHDPLETAIRAIIHRKAPIPKDSVEGWAALVCAIEARRLNQPVGTKLANPAGLLNLVYDHHQTFFPHLVRTLERLHLDPPEQRRGAWKKWVEAFHNGRFQDGPLPVPHAGSERLLAWLYPFTEISESPCAGA
jgi:hypothetical protein